MNIKTKLLLDKSIAKPFAFLLNFLVRIVGKITHIDHNLEKDFKTIAVCKFKGMGSIVQSTPMLITLRSKFPNAEIIYVSSKSNEAFLNKIDVIDTVIAVDDSSLLKFIKTNIKALFSLIKKHPEVYFDLEIYSDYSTLFTTFTLSKNRVGFYLRSSTFRMGIYTHMMFFNSRVPVSQAYLQMSKIIGCETENQKLYNFGKKSKSYFKSKNKYIVVNPNASDLRLERRWGSQNFKVLIKAVLVKYPDYNVVMIGAKSEQEYTRKISSAFSDERVIDISGKTSLDELISIITFSNLMITNDTGPMHLAFSVNIPVVCFFGPCSPEQYGMAENAYCLYKPLYCSPCVHDFEISPCKGNNVCMKLITVDDALCQIQIAMEAKKKNIKAVPDLTYEFDNVVLGMVNR